MCQVVEKLIDEKIPLSNITVLTPRSSENSQWQDETKLQNGCRLVWNLYPDVGEISCCTIHSYKGLESPVIILTELDHLYEDKAEELIYTAISRAKDHLIIIGKLPV